MVAAKVVVIGAGVAGLGAAIRASELGCSEVVVLEREQPGSGSSGRSVGVFNTQTLDPLDIEIRARALELIDRLERDRGFSPQRIGNIRVAHSEADLPALMRSQEVQRDLGITNSRIITRDELRKLVPDMVCDDLVGGLYGPTDGYMDGHVLCHLLWEIAKELGVEVRRNTVVTGHERGARHRHRLSTRTNETIEGDIVVNAAGPWAAQVGDLLGVEVPLVPQRHQVVLIRFSRPLPYTVPMINEYMPGSVAEALYFRQDGPAQLVAGLHTYLILPELDAADPDDYGESVDFDYLEDVAARFTARMPLDDAGFGPGWAGLYPLSPDGLFQVGPHDMDPSIVSVCALGGVGLTSGYPLGAVAVEWALLGKPQTVGPAAKRLLPDRDSLSSYRRSDGGAHMKDLHRPGSARPLGLR